MSAYHIFRSDRWVHYSTLWWAFWLVFLAALAGCAPGSPTPLPAIPVPVLTLTAPPATAAAPPTRTPAPALATLAPSVVARPAAVELAPPDPERPLRGFGPPAPSQQWLVTLRDFDTPLFVVHRLHATTAETGAFGLGQPWCWSRDGALLLWSPSAQPEQLLGLEPASGVTVTLATASQGPITGAAWLRASLEYAVQRPTGVQVLALTDSSLPASVVAQLPGRELLPGGMLAAPDGTSVALVVTQTGALTTELYLFDSLAGDMTLIDSTAAGQPDARATWSASGTLYYNLGPELKAYEPALAIVTPAGVDALPLSWSTTGLLARQRADSALLRWRSDGSLQPFESAGTPVLVQDIQAQSGTRVLALINGGIWQTDLP